MIVIGLAALAAASLAHASDPRSIQDPVLNEILTRHQDHPYPAGTPFLREPLECRFYSAAVVYHVLRDASGGPRILLTSVMGHADYHLFPNIVYVAEDGWMRTPVPYGGDGWTHVHVSEDGHNIVILMDNVPESPGWETRVVVSNDGGNTWSYGNSIRKYVYFDYFRYFAMDDSGVGTAVEHYDGDVGGYDRIGYYVYRTGDWGRTWSEREYHASFDTTDFADAIDSILASRADRKPLNEFTLPGFDACRDPALAGQ